MTDTDEKPSNNQSDLISDVSINSNPQTKTVQTIDPALLQLGEMIKGYLIQNQEKEISALEIELKDRRRITYAIVGAVTVIVLSTVWLTVIGKFEGSTFAFFLGTSVGSLLTILGKMFSIKD